jgi:hypothetical protein
VKATDEGGNIVAREKADLDDDKARRRLSRLLAAQLGADEEVVLEELKKGYFDLLGQVEKQRAAQDAAAGVGNQSEAEILDDAPDAVRRPLALAGGRAYAAAFIPVKRTVTQGVDPKTNQLTTYNPPASRPKSS